MEEKYNEATLQRPKGDRPLDAPFVDIDLPQFIKQIREETLWEESDRNAITVFKTNGLRIVLIALHKGAEMVRHTADGIISIQVLEGNMQFNTDQQSVELNKGQMLALHERIPHSILAIRESVFLLTLTTSLQEADIY
jgi:quercetin dioxygenase-like cupin family protein